MYTSWYNSMYIAISHGHPSSWISGVRNLLWSFYTGFVESLLHHTSRSSLRRTSFEMTKRDVFALVGSTGCSVSATRRINGIATGFHYRDIQPVIFNSLVCDWFRVKLSGGVSREKCITPEHYTITNYHHQCRNAVTLQ